MRSSWHLKALAVVAVLSLAMGACGDGTEPTATDISPDDGTQTEPDSTQTDGEQASGDPYKVGLTNSMTGPLAPAYAANTEGFRVFFEHLNANGGVGGHPVELVVEDNASDAAQVAQHARKFVSEDEVHVMVTATASISYEPLMTAGEESKVPVVLGGGAGCPPTILPPEPVEWTFCTSGGAAEVDGPVAAELLKTIAEEAGDDRIDVGLVALDVPVSRAEVERVSELGPELGINVKTTAVVPRGSADFAQFANQLNRADVNYAFAWAPWSTEAGVFQALDELGWEGTYLAAIQPPTEADLARIQRDSLNVFYARGMVATAPDAAAEMETAAQAVGAESPPETWADGWLSAKVIAAALEDCGWPCEPSDLRDSFENTSVDTGGLTGSPMTLSADNHFAFDSWRVFRWDSASSAVTAVTDWIEFGGLSLDERVTPAE